MPDLPARCLAVVAAIGGWLSAGAAVPTPPPQSVVVHAASSHVDYRTDSASFRDVIVSQGGIRVTAERCQAAGLGFDSSTWTFEGNVIVFMQPQARLQAERARVAIRNGRVVQATVFGTPATFESQRRASRPVVHGQANNVVYDAGDETVRLSGGAWLAAGQDERITGPLLIYDTREERLVGLSPKGMRGVHITVTPPAQPPPRRRRAKGRSGDHHRSRPISSSHSPDSGRRSGGAPAGARP